MLRLKVDTESPATQPLGNRNTAIVMVMMMVMVVMVVMVVVVVMVMNDFPQGE